MNNSNREKKIREEVTQFYDNIAQQFSQTRQNWWDNLNFIEKYINKNDRLLDFGCGNGRLLEFIYGKNLEVDYLGIDISQELIEIAKHNYPQEKFSVIEKENQLNYSDDHFDTIASIAVFHHFNPGMAENSLKEMKRILKKDGVVIITAWHLWNKKKISYLIKAFAKNLLKLKWTKIADLPFSYFSKEKGQKTYWRTCYWWRRGDLKKIAEKVGLKVLESGYSRDQRNNKRNIYWVLKK